MHRLPHLYRPHLPQLRSSRRRGRRRRRDVGPVRRQPPNPGPSRHMRVAEAHRAISLGSCSDSANGDDDHSTPPGEESPCSGRSARNSARSSARSTARNSARQQAIGKGDGGVPLPPAQPVSVFSRAGVAAAGPPAMAAPPAVAVPRDGSRSPHSASPTPPQMRRSNGSSPGNGYAPCVCHPTPGHSGASSPAGTPARLRSGACSLPERGGLVAACRRQRMHLKADGSTPPPLEARGRCGRIHAAPTG